MQPSPVEEAPSLLWGLDPVFSAFAKLYIKDVLEVKESQQVPGIFFYKGHPIKQVEILGTVVHVREKEAFYNYGGSASHQGTSGATGLDELMEELYQSDNKKAKMEIGDVIRVRGYIKIFRKQREIVASTFCKEDDPMFDMQIARMLDLPYLYRHVYDRPFQILQHMKDPSQELTDAEKGCHFLHILNCVRQRYGSNITENVMQRVIDALEGNSDIVGTMEKYYTAF
ncbi:hypothetical protein FKM82_014442 [Ascaphus truei]